MSRSRAERWVFLVVAVVLAAVFVRLGVWQLDRLTERRVANGLIEARMELPAAEVGAVASDPALSPDSMTWRHLHVRGSWDFDHEIVIRGQASRGTPGVHVVTPLLLGPDRGVLVLRGWLPAADGLSADLADARPDDRGLQIELEGLALASAAPSRIPPRTKRFAGAERLVLGTLSIEQASESIPYDLLPVFVLASQTAETPGAPRPLAAPAPSDGPHLWYAIQWFAFALISMAGAIAYVWTGRRSESPEGEGT